MQKTLRIQRREVKELSRRIHFEFVGLADTAHHLAGPIHHILFLKRSLLDKKDMDALLIWIFPPPAQTVSGSMFVETICDWLEYAWLAA